MSKGIWLSVETVERLRIETGEGLFADRILEMIDGRGRSC